MPSKPRGRLLTLGFGCQLLRWNRPSTRHSRHNSMGQQPFICIPAQQPVSTARRFPSVTRCSLWTSSARTNTLTAPMALTILCSTVKYQASHSSYYSASPHRLRATPQTRNKPAAATELEPPCKTWGRYSWYCTVGTLFDQATCH